MTIIEGLTLGLQHAIQPMALLFCFVGVMLGTFVGVLPGIGNTATVALLIPMTFEIPGEYAMMMLAGISYGALYGGSIISILLRIPGTTASIMTCIEGNELTKQGRAGVALFVASMTSFIGGMIGVIITIVAGPFLSNIGITLGPTDFASIMFFGLVACCFITTDQPVKNFSMVFVGLMIGMVGTDINSGYDRYFFGSDTLRDGLHILIVALGTFAIAEVISCINIEQKVLTKNFGQWLPTKQETKNCFWPIIRGSSIGSFIGALPGTGGTIASFIAYMVERKFSKNKDKFGHGSVEGIAAPESANNAAAHTAFIPTLTLGIPGDAIAVLLLGALMIYGYAPGPMMMQETPELFWGLVISFIIGNIILLIINLPLIRLWVKILQIPYNILFPSIIVLCCMAIWGLHFNHTDLLILAFFGALGYFIKILKFSPAPLVLGIMLEPYIESYI